MGCTVHIGREFLRVPATIRRKLRARLERICAVLEALETRNSLGDSLAQSSLAIRIESWSFRYEFEPVRNRIVVVQALPPSR
jgi:hypothetical protein